VKRSRGAVHGGSGFTSGRLKDTPSNQNARIYVGNLPYELRWEELRDFFKQAGEVVFVDILTFNGRSKGCAVVEFESQDQADRAIKELSDTLIQGRKIFVREDREADQKRSRESKHRRLSDSHHRDNHHQSSDRDRGRRSSLNRQKENVNQVHIANLPYSIAWQDLKDLFRQAGQVSRADVYQNSDRRSKGTGNVVFETRDEVESAIKMFNGFEWHGRKLEVEEGNGQRGESFNRRSSVGGGGGGRYAVPGPGMPPYGMQPYVMQPYAMPPYGYYDPSFDFQGYGHMNRGGGGFNRGGMRQQQFYGGRGGGMPYGGYINPHHPMAHGHHHHQQRPAPPSRPVISQAGEGAEAS